MLENREILILQNKKQKKLFSNRTKFLNNKMFFRKIISNRNEPKQNKNEKASLCKFANIRNQPKTNV